MSQTKAQLIQPIGVVTASGIVVSGVMTAASFDGNVVGSATSIIQGSNLNVGAFNASSFAGDFTGNATGIITSSAIKVGQLTASSFVGDFTGTATSMAKGTGFKAGTVTATPANVTYAVTVGSKTGGGNAFYLDGIEAPVPSLYPGATYTFDQSDSTNGDHPLRFATAADAAGSTGYSVGVTVNGTQGTAGAYTRIVVSPSAPDTLYYYCTAHSGMGDSINITNLLQGPVTGNVTGDVQGNIDGDLTGNLTGDVTGNVTGNVTGVSTGNVTGNVTGNLVGAAKSVIQGTNIHVGVVTVTGMSGDGSNLTGIAATNYNTQTVTANSATTTIDLSAGNMIKFNQTATTTVSFANTSSAMDITIIRQGASASGSVTWPNSVKWNGEVAPSWDADGTISQEFNQIQLITRDSGVTWYGWENGEVEYSVKYNLYIWGCGEDGTPGQNTTINLSSPVQVPGVWAHINVQRKQKRCVHATKPNGSLWFWGNASNGMSGMNSQTKRSSPIQVGTDTNWSLFNLGGSGPGVVVSKTDGTLWSWGGNTDGSLGQNDQDNAMLSSPTQIGTDTNWATSIYSITRSGDECCGAIKTDGTLWIWGDNKDGQLGLNQPGPSARSSPTQIPGTTWSKVFGGSEQISAIKTDATLWQWGRNYHGMLGQNSVNDGYSSPVQIPGSWDNVSSGGYRQSFGVKTDGKGYVWGRGYYGSMGTTPSMGSVSISSPTQLPGTWNQGTVALFPFTIATQTNGTLWAWGRNNDQGGGNLGQNDRTNSGTPVQIPGTTWRYAWGAFAASYALKDAE